MLESVDDSVFIDIVGNVVGNVLDLVFGVAHRYANGAVAEHGEVVAPVAKGHSLREIDVEISQHFVDAGSFVAAFRDYVAEVGVPACRFAAFEDVAVEGWIVPFFFVAEAHELNDVLAFCFRKVSNRYGRNIKHVPYASGIIVETADENISVGRYDAKLERYGRVCVDEPVDIALVDASPEYYSFFVGECAHSSVDGYISVYFGVAEVVDPRDVTSGGDKDFNAFAAQCGYGIFDFGRDVFVAEGDQSAVDVEKNSFYIHDY